MATIDSAGVLQPSSAATAPAVPPAKPTSLPVSGGAAEAASSAAATKPAASVHRKYEIAADGTVVLPRLQ
jgi:hypothetical protein